MGLDASPISTAKPAVRTERIAPYLEERRISEHEQYGTFAERVAELNKYDTVRIPADKEEIEAGKYDSYVGYYDIKGDFVGGIATKRTKDGKIEGAVTIGNVTYNTDDITGNAKIKRIFDKRGAVAVDRDGNGTVNGELSILAPPFSKPYYTSSGEKILCATPEPDMTLINPYRRRPFSTHTVNSAKTTDTVNQ